MIQNYIGESLANHTEDKKVEHILKLRENCNNPTCARRLALEGANKEGGPFLHGKKGTGKGLKYVNVSQKNKGAQDVQNKKGRGEFRTREESEPKSREGGARTREFGNWGGSEQGVVGVKTKEESEQGRWDSEQGRWWRRLAPRDRRLCPVVGKREEAGVRVHLQDRDT